jgi:hypothetical protein
VVAVGRSVPTRLPALSTVPLVPGGPSNEEPKLDEGVSLCVGALSESVGCLGGGMWR